MKSMQPIQLAHIAAVVVGVVGLSFFLRYAALSPKFGFSFLTQGETLLFLLGCGALLLALSTHPAALPMRVVAIGLCAAALLVTVSLSTVLSARGTWLLELANSHAAFIAASLGLAVAAGLGLSASSGRVEGRPGVWLAIAWSGCSLALVAWFVLLVYSKLLSP